MLAAIPGSAYPISKSSLLGQLQAAEVDADIVAAAAALDAIEFIDPSDLGDALDMAFGMPDANSRDSVLETES